jgi:hypothetical protein
MNAANTLEAKESTKSVDATLVRARLWWLLQPMGALGLVLWILHPAVSDRLDPTDLALPAFLFGVAYGLVLFGQRFLPYIRLAPLSGRHQPNRVPAEYYWGEISQVLFENR